MYPDCGSICTFHGLLTHIRDAVKSSTFVDNASNSSNVKRLTGAKFDGVGEDDDHGANRMSMLPPTWCTSCQCLAPATHYGMYHIMLLWLARSMISLMVRVKHDTIQIFIQVRATKMCNTLCLMCY